VLEVYVDLRHGARGNHCVQAAKFNTHLHDMGNIFTSVDNVNVVYDVPSEIFRQSI
jgi:hypothetical protein